MPRNMKAHESEKAAKAKRTFALQRNELRQASSPRRPASGPWSMPVKTVDPEIERMISEFLAAKAVEPIRRVG